MYSGWFYGKSGNDELDNRRFEEEELMKGVAEWRLLIDRRSRADVDVSQRFTVIFVINKYIQFIQFIQFININGTHNLYEGRSTQSV